MIIAPSLLSADFLHLEREIEMINNSEASWIHCDIMDGRFVPNLSFGLPIVKAVKSVAKKPLDVHLMIVEPEKYFEAFRDAGADILTFHIEATNHVHRAIDAIKRLGMKAGVVLNPHTNVMLIKDVIVDLDLVLIMSVNPGFGGQSFIENSYEKIRETKALINSKKSKALIEVDGGVSIKNAKQLALCGANALVAGNSVFSSPDPQKAIKDLHHCLDG